LPKFASQTSNEKSVMSLQKGEIYTDILTWILQTFAQSFLNSLE
jgi:hypothetical protein